MGVIVARSMKHVLLYEITNLLHFLLLLGISLTFRIWEMRLEKRVKTEKRVETYPNMAIDLFRGIQLVFQDNQTVCVWHA